MSAFSSDGSDHIIDWSRGQRTGVPEAVFASGKTIEQLAAILEEVAERQQGILITRLEPSVAESLVGDFGDLRYHPPSRTAVLGNATGGQHSVEDVAIVAAGTSDLPVAQEASATLRYLGHIPATYFDVGVAGLWRLLDRVDQIRQARVIIAVAGMEGALFSVIGGLVAAPVIAVPTSVGYGIASGGRAALSSALATCAPGVVTVNIDNGFGAAVAAVKMLAMMRRGSSLPPNLRSWNAS